MIYSFLAFGIVAFITWRITRSSYNVFAHFLNAGLDNEAVTHESQLNRYLASAERYYDERKWLAAEKAYLKVLKLDHKNLTAYRRLGLVYSHLKNYADATECYELVVKRRPTAADWQNYATILFYQKKYHEAADALDRSIEMEPTLARFIALARVWRSLQEHLKQFEALAAAHEFEPDNKAVMQLLAKYHEERGDTAQAKRWQDRANGR
ncbi:tetratricopeptide repeat protein [Candidatus Saccharibacteria bacterium]|nr:tetratricopeptide repeat protein [Candidatus Saccharibacteria bacterium]